MRKIIRSIKILGICLIIILIGKSVYASDYAWVENIPMPDYLSKAEQQKIADSVIVKVNTPDLKKNLVSKFPNIPKEWIQGIEIRATDATKVYDYNGKGIEIWIQMPSSKEASSLPSPVVEYLASIIEKQIGVCCTELQLICR